MTQSKVRRVRGVLSDDFNDLSLMYEFFDAAEKHSKPTTAPSLILTCANIECKETQINRQGFQVHTLVLPAATLSLPEPITQLPGFTRVHAILQLVTDCDEGDLLTIDSVSRVEDGVRRMQTWGYVKEGPSVRVHQHWNELEDEGAEEIRRLAKVKGIMDLFRGGREKPEIGEIMIEQGEEEREKLRKETARRRMEVARELEKCRNEYLKSRPGHRNQRSEEIVDSEIGRELGEITEQIDKIKLTDDQSTAPIAEVSEPCEENFVEVLASVAAPVAIPLPHAPRDPSPLRQSFVVVADDDGLPNDVGYLAPSVQVREKTPPTATPKTSYPHTFAIADPDNDYRPTIVAHPPHFSSDSESEIDELSSDSDDSNDRPLLLDASSLSSQPPADSNDTPTRKPRGRKKVDIRGHMLLRSGTITGAPRYGCTKVHTVLTEMNESGMQPQALGPLPGFPPSPFSPTLAPTALPNVAEPSAAFTHPLQPSNDEATSPQPDLATFSCRQTVSRIFDHEDGTQEEVVESESDVLMHVVLPSTAPTDSEHDTANTSSTPNDRTYPGAEETGANPVHEEVVLEGTSTQSSNNDVAANWLAVQTQGEHGPVLEETSRIVLEQIHSTSVPYPSPPLSPTPSLPLPDLVDLIDLSTDYPTASAPTTRIDDSEFPYVPTTLNSPPTFANTLGVVDFPITNFTDLLEAIENPPHRLELDALSTMANAGTTSRPGGGSSSPQEMEDVERTVDPLDLLDNSSDAACAAACAAAQQSTTAVPSSHDRTISNHRFHLPLVTAQVEALVVNENSFVPPHALCESDKPLPQQFYAPVLEPLQAHMQMRRHFCFVLEYATLEALDRGLNAYVQHLHSSVSNPNMYTYHDIYHVRSEWTGNPFLYAIERFRLTQAARYFEDMDPDRTNPTLSTLRELIDEVLSFSVPPTDWEMIARQRLAGFYGPPYSMPLHP